MRAEKYIKILCIILISLLFQYATNIRAQDLDQDDIPDATEVQIAYMFSPILHAHPEDDQEGLADANEFLIEHSVPKLKRSGPYYLYDDGEDLNWNSNSPWESLFVQRSGIVCAHGEKPGWSPFTVDRRFNIDIFDSDWHLAPENIADRPLYYHVWKDDNYYYVQYWYFFLCNDIRDEVWQLSGESYHEGDWEHIQIRLIENNGVFTPDMVEFHEHYGGLTYYASECYWSETNSPQQRPGDPGFNPSRTHIHVWIAKNSHSSYNLFQPLSCTRVEHEFVLLSYYYEEVDYDYSCSTYWEYSPTLVKLGEIEDQTVGGSNTGYHNDYEHPWDTHFAPVGDSQEFLAFHGYFGDDYSYIDFRPFYDYVHKLPPPMSPAKHPGWKSFNDILTIWGEWSPFHSWYQPDDVIVVSNYHPQADVVWDQPLYLLTQDYEISPTTTLTIEPGVTVIGLNTPLGGGPPRISVLGSIDINGTEEQPVTFMAMFPEYHKCPRIYIQDSQVVDPITSIEHTYFLCSDDNEFPAIEIEQRSNPPLRQVNIDNVQISNFKYGIKDCRNNIVYLNNSVICAPNSYFDRTYGIHISDHFYPAGCSGSLYIDNVVFSDINRGILVSNESGPNHSIHITNSEFTDISDFAILASEQQNFQLNNCIFENCDDKAVIIANSLAKIGSNEFTDIDEIAIELTETFGHLTFNSFTDTRIGIKLDQSPVSFRGNFIDTDWRGIRSYSCSPIYSYFSLGGYNVVHTGDSNGIPVQSFGANLPLWDGGFNQLYNSHYSFTYEIYFGNDVLVDEYQPQDVLDRGPVEFPDTYWGGDIDEVEVFSNVHDTGSRWAPGVIKTDLGMMEQLGYVPPTNYFNSPATYSNEDQNRGLFDLSGFLTGCANCHVFPESPDIQTQLTMSNLAADGFTGHGPSTTFSSVTKQKLFEAYDEIADTSYQQGASILVDILSGVYTDATDPDLLAAIDYLVMCDLYDETLDHTQLLTNISNTIKTISVKAGAIFALASIDRLNADFTSAIIKYEDIITDPEYSEIDKIRAKINSGRIYIKLASELDDPTESDIDLILRLSQVPVLGSISSLKPTSLSSHENNVETLFSSLEADPTYSETLISGNVVWDQSEVHLLNDLTIESSGTLTISPGTAVLGDNVKIDVFGELNVLGEENSKISFSPLTTDGESGISIYLHPGSSRDSQISDCIFIKSPNALVVMKQLNYPIQRTFFEDCAMGIAADESYPVVISISDCDFISDNQFTDVGLVLKGILTDSYVERCNFIGAMQPIVALNSEFDITDCYIDNIDTLVTSDNISAIDLTYCSGRISHNTILNYPTGIRFYDSDMSLYETKIETCYNEGLWIQHDSFPYLKLMNWLRYNGESAITPTQILIEGDIYPLLSEGENNIWAAEYGYAIVSDSGPSDYTDLQGNYWGTSNPVPQDLFYPYSTKINLLPYLTAEQIPRKGYQTISTFENLFSDAIVSLESENYDTAIDLFQQIVENDTTTSLRAGAISYLLTSFIRSEGNLEELASYLEIQESLINNDRLRLTIQNTIARINTKLSRYELAIEHYEDIIGDDGATFEDSIFAVIDAGYVYLAAEEKDDGRTTGSVEYGEIEALCPVDQISHEKKVHELLGLLRGQSVRTDYMTTIPTSFELKPAYPNPFNPTIAIPFEVPKQAEIKIAVYNVLGQKVTTLIDRQINAGNHKIIWNGRDQYGSQIASGVYFIQMTAPNFVKAQKVVMLK